MRNQGDWGSLSRWQNEVIDESLEMVQIQPHSDKRNRNAFERIELPSTIKFHLDFFVAFHFLKMAKILLIRPFAGAPTEKRPALGPTRPGWSRCSTMPSGGIGLEERLAGMFLPTARLAPGLLLKALGIGQRVETAMVVGGRAAADEVGNRAVLRWRSRTLASSASTRSYNRKTRS